MAEALENVIQRETRCFVEATTFVAINVDKANIVDNQLWLSHAYVVKDWERVPILISLHRVVVGGTSNSLSSVILKACATEGTLDGQALAKKSVCFGANGVNIFGGGCTCLTTQLKENYVPFMVGIHCCAHQVNLFICYYVRLPHSCQVWGASPICATVLLYVKCFFFIASHVASLQ